MDMRAKQLLIKRKTFEDFGVLPLCPYRSVFPLLKFFLSVKDQASLGSAMVPGVGLISLEFLCTQGEIFVVLGLGFLLSLNLFHGVGKMWRSGLGASLNACILSPMSKENTIYICQYETDDQTS